ncbi:MAG: PLP-dependent aminotransferase family protein [Paracoccus sp. (in: a-proteobacteria)]
MQLALSLSSHSSRTLQDQVFEQIRDMILSTRLKSGDPVPGSRALAECLGVSRNTVTIAYDKLFSEGYLEIRPNVGTFVAQDLPDLSLTLVGAQPDCTPCAEAPATPTLLDRISNDSFRVQAVAHPAARRLRTDFWVGRVDPLGFPATEWRRIVDTKLRHGPQRQASYGDTQGEEALRRAIADHVGPARGVACTAEDILVVGGSQDGLMLIAQALQQHCPAFLHENPCYQGACYIFERLGLTGHPVPVDRDGLVADALPDIRHAILYVTPSHQFPTGATLSLPRRLALLDWAERTDSLIIEDDYDGDFRYEGGPLTALRGLDRSGRVLYLGTFSKSMGPALRLGFIVGSDRTIPALARWKHLFSNGTPWIIQAAMAEFLDSGAFQRHLRRIRASYKRRRDVLIEEIGRHFPGSEIAGRRGGMHVSWRLPGTGRARHLQRLAQLRGIGIYTVEDGGACLSPGDGRHDDLLMLGYAAIEEGQIARAIALLGELDRGN